MATTTIHVPSVSPQRVPRGAVVAAALYAGASNWLRRQFAARAQTRVEEAAEVRALANRLRDADPSFAADLYAAALRHEALDDARA